MEEEDKIREEDSQFMKLAKKLTAKALQKKGECCNKSFVGVDLAVVYVQPFSVLPETSSVPLQEKPVSNANPFQKPCKPVVSVWMKENAFQCD